MSIKVYSTPTCAYCPMVKKYLKMKNLDFEEIDIDKNPEQVSVIQKLTGFISVPVTTIEKDGKISVVQGYNLSKLSSLIN